MTTLFIYFETTKISLLQQLQLFIFNLGKLENNWFVSPSEIGFNED